MMEFLTTVYVLTTIVYAYLTYHILKANQSQIKASVRPYVHFDLMTKGALVEAVLKNTGVTGAFDVSVNVSPKIESSLRGERQKACLTSFPVSMLSSGRELRECLCSLDELKKQSPEMAFSGTIKYQDAAGKIYNEPFRIDLSDVQNMVYIMRPDIAEELKTIAEQLGDIKNTIQRIGDKLPN